MNKTQTGHLTISASMILALLLLMTPIQPVHAEEIRVAVASNFRNSARLIAEQFHAGSEHQAIMIYGSSGKHFAQISKGAPYDIMLSADSERPEKLEQEGLAVAGTRVSYAIGRLVLWSSNENLVDAKGDVLRAGNFNKLAMANPRYAPYGAAARTVLENLQLKDALADKIVLGGNIEQAFQYITSGNADLGFVARSQLAESVWGKQGSRWEIPVSLYEPIVQQAVLLKDKAAARQFLTVLTSKPARKIIQEHGYDLP